jgi:hypothetical protein
MNLTITKGFVGETRDAIVEVRDDQLRLCYNLDKKGRPKEFATKDGDHDRSMIVGDQPRLVISPRLAASRRSGVCP